MRRFGLLLFVFLCVSTSLFARLVITPYNAHGSSRYHSVMDFDRAIDGSGLTVAEPFENSTHTAGGMVYNNLYWQCSWAADFVTTPTYIQFDLDVSETPYAIDGMLIWNMNEVYNGASQTNRGVKEMDVVLSTDAVIGNADDITLCFRTSGGDFGPIDQGPGSDNYTADVYNFGQTYYNIRFIQFNIVSNYGFYDPTRGYLAALAEVRFLGAESPYAHNPVPADNSAGVGTVQGGQVNVSLGWDAGLDPANPAQPNSAIKKHYLYLSRDRNLFTNDPNLYFEAEITASGATGAYNATGLNYGGLYVWKVEEGLDDGYGGVYAPGDPNNIEGLLWHFSTIEQLPVVLEQPADIRVETGFDAQLLVSASSLSSLSYQWYKYVDGTNDLQLTDGIKYSGATTAVLTVANVQANDSGLYYCTLVNTAGSVNSELAGLSVNRVLAWYQFENNADDSAGTNHGTEVGNLVYTSDTIVNGGQSYAADPNGSSYIQLSTEAYPKAGFGNGLERGTIAFWVKTDSTISQAVLGSWNPTSPVDDRTAVAVLAPYTASGQLRFYLRDFGNKAVELITPATSISDNQWHYVAISYDTAESKEVKAYFDGELIGNAAISQNISNFTDWQFPMVVLAQNARGVIGSGSLGQIDDLKIYNYVLDHNAIAETTYNISGKNPCMSPISAIFDYDGNCLVDMADLAHFAKQWLECGRFICE